MPPGACNRHEATVHVNMVSDAFFALPTPRRLLKKGGFESDRAVSGRTLPRCMRNVIIQSASAYDSVEQSNPVVDRRIVRVDELARDLPESKGKGRG